MVRSKCHAQYGGGQCRLRNRLSDGPQRKIAVIEMAQRSFDANFAISYGWVSCQRVTN